MDTHGNIYWCDRPLRSVSPKYVSVKKPYLGLLDAQKYIDHNGYYTQANG